MTDKVLMGGIDRNSDFYGANRDKVKAVLRAKTEEAIRQAGPKLIVSGGCEFNRLDGMHLTRRGHAQLAQRLAEAVPGLL